MLTFNNFLVIGIGAALGAISRWLLGLWLNHHAALMPWGTLAANFIGAYVIGLAMGVLSLYPEVPQWLRLALITGFLGGLTTFSTFSAETVGLLEHGAYLTGLGYVAVSVLGSLGLTALGMLTIQLLR
jgi:CrcB protein